ncbi:MAG: DUF192 domain-containing protein [Alphaproteobacteria bacterium]
MKKFLTVLLTLCIFACAKEDPKKEITIQTKDKEVKYNVEIAKTKEELEKGLMFRETLNTDSGMFFEFEEVNGAVMWMKNTKISLDILFMSPEGKIVCIKESATPMSEDFIICREKVASSLEVNAGEVAKHNIKIGDTVK